MTVPRTGAHLVTSSAGQHDVLVFWRKDCLVLLGRSLITVLVFRVIRSIKSYLELSFAVFMKGKVYCVTNGFNAFFP